LISESQRLESLAERLRSVDPVAPSPAAKIRGWNLVIAAVERSSSGRSPSSSLRRLILAPIAAVVLVAAGTLAASANSLPDSPLYPIKGALEQARGALAFNASDRLSYHLDLAQTRLTEAEAMIASHRIDLANRALSAMDDQLQNAADVVGGAKQSDPTLGSALQNRLQEAIEVHDAQLEGLQGQITNPTAQAAIAAARDRASQELQQLNKGTATGQDNRQGQGQGQNPRGSPSPHPTPKNK
jgi:hypothetical protein